MTANYAREKFTAGVHMLAEGQEDVRRGLIDAYVEASHGRRDKQLPPAMAKRIEALHQRMTRVTPKGEEGSIAATVAAMTDEEVVEAVHEIEAIALELQAAG
jgi:hypothetical protein